MDNIYQKRTKLSVWCPNSFAGQKFRRNQRFICWSRKSRIPAAVDIWENLQMKNADSEGRTRTTCHEMCQRDFNTKEDKKKLLNIAQNT
jgi:hypothetical protein